MEQYIAAVVVAVLGLLAKAANDWIKANITPQKLARVSELAHIAVVGAERFGQGLQAITGPEKYAVAEMALLKGAKRLGVKLSDEEASAYIHAALAELTGLVESVEGQAAAA